MWARKLVLAHFWVPFAAFLAAVLLGAGQMYRHNDPEAQMRNMVRAMAEPEIDQVAEFYSRKAGVAEAK